MDKQPQLVAIKRSWVPEWLYAVVVRSTRALGIGFMTVHFPLRQILHRELSAREIQGIEDIPETK